MHSVRKRDSPMCELHIEGIKNKQLDNVFVFFVKSVSH